MKSILIQTSEIKEATKVLRAVNHKIRREILHLLEVKKKLTVSQIYTAMKLQQSICSQHLSILHKAGVICVEPVKKFRYYYINLHRVEQINGLAKELAAKNIPCVR